MRPLLWKEMRDLRPWLLGAAALAVAIVLLCASKRFERDFLELYVPMLPLPVLAAAVALGVGQVARERAARTIEFMLTRPVSAAAIVWAKFVAGTVALALLLAAVVGLAYVDPAFRDASGVMVFRQTVGFWRLLLTVFPRAWCVYALALLLSTLVNRTSKAAAALVVSAIAILELNGVYASFRPFSEMGPWYWFIDDRPLETALRLARDEGLFRVTGLGLSAIAIALALLATFIFARRPRHALSNRTLVMSGCSLIALAVAASKVDANVLPVSRAIAGIELKMDSQHDLVAIAASGDDVAVASTDSVAFLDFADASHPRKVAEARLPLWETKSLTMSGGVAYLIGVKKALPVDEIEVATAKRRGDTVEIQTAVDLGSVNEIVWKDTVVPLGKFLFVDVIRRRQCRIEVYDLADGGRLAAALLVDTMSDPPPGTAERDINPGSMRMVLVGQYLYVTSPSALTAIDVTDPAHPIARSRMPFRAPFADYYAYSAFPRDLMTDGSRLIENQFLPTVWKTYDLSDPAHPSVIGHASALENGVVSGDGLLMEPWHGGVMEFRAAGGNFEGVRLLADEHRANAWVAASEDRVYTFKRVEDHRWVSEYQLPRGTAPR